MSAPLYHLNISMPPCVGIFHGFGVLPKARDSAIAEPASYADFARKTSHRRTLAKAVKSWLDFVDLLQGGKGCALDIFKEGPAPR